MRKIGLVVLLFVFACVSVLGLTACGSGSGGKEGGTLTGSYAAFPDALDPAISYSSEGWTALYNIYIPLLTYAHASGTAGSKVIPGLATRLPKISNGGKTYTLILRTGLKYSNDTPVKASDFPSSVERMLRARTPAAPPSTPASSAPKSSPKPRQGGSPASQLTIRRAEIVINLTSTARHLHQRAGAAVRRPAAAEHADQEPDRRPAAGDRPLRDRQVRTGTWLVIRAQPAVGQGQRQADAGNPRWPRRQDRHQGRQQRLDPGQRHRTRQDRLDADRGLRRTATRK